MNRDIFDEKLGKTPEKREHYEPAQLYELQHIIDSLVREHMDGTLKQVHSDDVGWTVGFEDVVKHISPMLEPLKERPDEVNSFLDTLLFRAADAKHNLEYLFCPVVQALYNQGHNDFTVDLSYYSLGKQDLISALHGEEDRPLKLTLNASGFNYFGWLVKHCELTLSGDCLDIACNAENSTFHIHNELGRTLYLGMGAQECDFYIDSLAGVSVCGNAYNCNVYGTGNLNAKIPALFCKNGNKLFEPDPDNPGEWMEVEL